MEFGSPRDWKAMGRLPARVIAVMIGLTSLMVTAAHDATAAAPLRVVSMNLCTDQLALLVAGKGQLVSVSNVSHDADAAVLAIEARRYPANAGFAEEIFVLRPDLVVTGSFTRAASTALLRRLGYKVEVFEPALRFTDIRANLLRMGTLLGQPDQTARVVSAFDNELRRLATSPRSRRSAALYASNSFTSGRDTLASEIVQLAGLDNLASRLGLTGPARLPLELLVLSRPDVIVRERPRHRAAALAREVLRHPALVAAERRAKATAQSDQTWICGLPFALDAARRLSAAARAGRGGQP